MVPEAVAVDTPSRASSVSGGTRVRQRTPADQLMSTGHGGDLVDPSLVTTRTCSWTWRLRRPQLRRVGGGKSAWARGGRAEDGRPARSRLGSLHPHVRRAGHPARSFTLGAHGAMAKRPRIAVVGSANVDLTTFTDEFPRPGETLFAPSFDLGFGGKGAKGVAAACAGATSNCGARGQRLFARHQEPSRPGDLARSHVKVREAWPAWWPPSSWKVGQTDRWSRGATITCCPPTWTRPALLKSGTAS